MQNSCKLVHNCFSVFLNVVVSVCKYLSLPLVHQITSKETGVKLAVKKEQSWPGLNLFFYFFLKRGLLPCAQIAFFCFSFFFFSYILAAVVDLLLGLLLVQKFPREHHRERKFLSRGSQV